MKMKNMTLIVVATCLTFTTVRAQDTLFGEAGSGQPTKTVIGILGGAAAGSAIGAATGGHDAPWIGALVGGSVGGLAGNQWGAAEANDNKRYFGGESYRYESRPRKVVRVVEERPVRVTRVIEEEDGVPYGFLSGGQIQSPWSSFTMSVGGKTSGQVLYDPNTGQAFRIP